MFKNNNNGRNSRNINLYSNMNSTGRGNDRGRRMNGLRPSGRRGNTQGTSPDTFDRRLKFIQISMIVVLCLFVLRLVYIQIYKGTEYHEAAQAFQVQNIPLTARRGTIYDRNGNVLAQSIECKTVYANPKEVSDANATAQAIVDELGGDKQEYIELLTQDTTFVYIKKKVDTSVSERLLDREDTFITAEEDKTGVSGLYALDDMKRIYPYGSTGSQVLGVVGNDGAGLTGLELYYNDILSGVDGYLVTERGQDGTPVAGGEYERVDACDGEDIIISLDIGIQSVAEKAITSAVEEYSADSGDVFAVDPNSGEILAACSTPLLNPDDLANASAESFNLKPISSAYEPGSTFKTITSSLALEAGTTSVDKTYNCPAYIMSGSDKVTDAEPRSSSMIMDLNYIIAHSSNVGAVMVGTELGADKLAEGVATFGFGATTDVDYPGEAIGLVTQREDYDGGTVGAMSFGQAIMVTPVQMTRAVSAIANGGLAYEPHFLISKGGDAVNYPEGERLISTATADDVVGMMRSVVTDGTAENAVVPGYTVAGKTGTAQQADIEHGGYIENHFVSSFIGFAPSTDPKATVYVLLDGVTEHGGAVAVPTFNTIMTQAMLDLSVQPDDDGAESTDN